MNVAGFGSGSCRLRLLWAVHVGPLLRNGVTASGVWVRHGLLQDMQDLFKEPPEMGRECFNPLSQENRTPRLLSPSTLPLGMLGVVFGAPHRSGILQGSRWDERHFGGGNLWDVSEDVGLETSQLREELKPKSLFGFISSEPKASHGQPCPSLWQEKLWIISRCGEWSYPLGV